MGACFFFRCCAEAALGEILGRLFYIFEQKGGILFVEICREELLDKTTTTHYNIAKLLRIT